MDTLNRASLNRALVKKMVRMLCFSKKQYEKHQSWIIRVPRCTCMYICCVQQKLEEYQERQQMRDPAAKSKMADMDRHQISLLKKEILQIKTQIVDIDGTA